MATKKILNCFGVAILIVLVLCSIYGFKWPQEDIPVDISAQHFFEPAPGIILKITGVTIPESTRKPVISFTLTDNNGNGLDPTKLSRLRFTIAALIMDPNTGLTRYSNYILTKVTSPITGSTANQPAVDSGGTFTIIDEDTGKAQYTFGTALPADYNRSLPHTVGAESRRVYQEVNYDDNDTFDFVPAGGALPFKREVVNIDNCNECHGLLKVHGGIRREYKYCRLCHTDQNVDPDTGNNLDFKIMIHKIHRGEDLPSVKAEKPYKIIGFQQSVHDFSDVVFPQAIRNCTKCHRNADQADNYKNRPSIEACGACHDDLNFATGEKHPGGVRTNEQCTFCHEPDGDEFDLSVAGAHTIPEKSKQLTKLEFEIVSVSNAKPGQKPTVVFKINRGYRSLSAADLNSLRLTIGGPTTEYSWWVREAVTGQNSSGPDAQGNITYTFSNALPSNASGTYAVGIEGRKSVTLNGQEVFETGDNVVKYVAITDSRPNPRRIVVSTTACNVACHDRLEAHGRRANDTEYCVICHNPDQTDESERPADKMPPEFLHFKILIHRLHTGRDLAQKPFIIYDKGEPREFSDVLFPGDRRRCNTCHAGKSYLLPLPSGLRDTVVTQAGREIVRVKPITAACIACHDATDAIAHADLMTSSRYGESCGVCHGEGADFAVSKKHEPLP